MGIEVVSTDEVLPPFFEELPPDGMKSPYFLLNGSGADFKNFESGAVRKHLGNLGLSDVSASEFLMLSGLNDRSAQQSLHDISSDELSVTSEFILQKGDGKWRSQHCANPQRQPFQTGAYASGDNGLHFSVRCQKWKDSVFGYVFHVSPYIFSDNGLSSFERNHFNGNSSIYNFQALKQKAEIVDRGLIGHMMMVGELSTIFFEWLLDKKEKCEISDEISNLLTYSKDDVHEFKRNA